MQESRNGIVTGGTWCVDRNLLIDHWPDENGFATGLNSEDANGGSASNLAINMRKIDPAVPVATMGVVGDDPNGQFLLGLADYHGIDRTRIRALKDIETAYTYCFTSRDTGKRTHLAYLAGNKALTPDHFDFSGLSHRIFHLGLPGVHEQMDQRWDGFENGWAATLKKAGDAGFICNLELCSVERQFLTQLVRPCLPFLDLLVVNDFEIGCATDIETLSEDGTDVAACIAAARTALDRGVKEIVVAHFPRGAVAVTRDGSVTSQPSVRVPEGQVAGANGAGDAFAAGFVYGYHQGWATDRSLALGHAVAAASLRAESTCGAIDSWSACLELADRWGWRDPLTSS